MLTKLGWRSLDGGIARALPRMDFRRWPIAIITTLTVIVVQRGTHETIPNAAASVVSIAAGLPQPRAYAPEDTLADHISYWDVETHMSKAEWLAACRRTQNGMDPAG